MRRPGCRGDRLLVRGGSGEEREGRQEVRRALLSPKAACEDRPDTRLSRRSRSRWKNCRERLSAELTQPGSLPPPTLGVSAKSPARERSLLHVSILCPSHGTDCAFVTAGAALPWGSVTVRSIVLQESLQRLFTSSSEQCCSFRTLGICNPWDRPGTITQLTLRTHCKDRHVLWGRAESTFLGGGPRTNTLVKDGEKLVPNHGPSDR